MWSILDFIHILHRHRLEISIRDPLRLDMCLATATKCIDEIDILAEQGPLPIMQDTGSCMTSALIVFLSKVRRSIRQVLMIDLPRLYKKSEIVDCQPTSADLAQPFSCIRR